METVHDVQKFKSLIDGEWVESQSSEWFQSINPADTSDILGQFPNMNHEDAVRAVDAAALAFADWRKTSPTKRSSILIKAAQLLDERRERYAEELCREEGKLYGAASKEVARSASTLRFYAQEILSFTGETFPSDDGDAFVFSHREPLGVVAVITPWNFPMSIPSRKIAPALAAGNTVVFKPASDTPLTALRLVECLYDAGLPKGVLNFVTGQASRVSAALTTDVRIRAITFTGSTRAGEAIHSKASLTTRTQMELGGKNPLILMEDGNLEKAVDLTIKGGYGLTGQACTGTSRVIVMRSVYDEFLPLLIEAAKSMKIGNGLDKGVEMGPLANQSQLDTVLSYIELGKKEGARLVYGGEHLTGGEYAKGYYVTPAIFADATQAMTISREEIFGPVISVIPVDSLEEALEAANDVEYGLSASLVTRDINKANLFVREIEAGTVKVNRTTTGNLINAPFGGLKRSSTTTFRESGRTGLEFFTQIKTVYYGGE
ncbi:aldehyde dehydrogenase family protein [Alicyclobacillus sp. SO9]|uniref:aldehyde dehydrogenase family protein n=1 Tax=Alicyclobacillus sp. SO9 TaxID=2665646 RepID=UPI0018E7C129|nr:aldehyde dehydrogenase family protein [Alicyclobacillus sp. SO9]QQE78659.1 aldehyde dehydrogenase family protein [Alicyclobacillus sp. SO9]